MNFSRQLCRRSGAIFLLGLTSLAHGSARDADLQRQYAGEVLTLRQFYAGEHLHFDAAGKLASAAQPGVWTVDGQLRVEDIFLKDGVVHIRGQRLFLFFDPENKRMRDVGSVTKTDTASKLFRKKKVDAWSAKHGKTEIEVECGTAQPEMADLTKAMNAVFLAPGEALTEVVPDFWKAYFAPRTESASAGREPQFVARVGKDVSPPRALYSPDPSYSELARQAGYQAVTLLWLIVDPNGLPQNIRIVKPVGMGLDDAAVNAVKTWKFDPAKKDGNAVAVQINVEVSFKLY